ncbi:MAG TPA: hypothetical protein ENJ91_02420 [Rhodobacteraceae bacterium]|nr:hypothetical protein [Paracoccaceae bacterium]
MAIRKTATGLLLMIGGMVAACAPAPATKKNYLSSCIAEVRAKGSYALSSTRVAPNGLPKVEVQEGGDARGAVLVEACIEQKHKADGTMPAPVGKQAPVKMKNGKLSAPQGYNLSAEDIALWNSLTLEQQKRAWEFLKSGSTIQSSLLGDQ